jgi:hypothetical protein
LGVKTIISVDGATPDLDRASARGMRYVHIPITYSTVTTEQQLEIARAIRDLPGPVYLHCHHGKHRGPAAAAAAAVLLGMMNPDEAVAFMKEAGTADTYTGLYQCVAEATPASTAALDAAPGAFPEVRRAHGIVAAMVEIDLALEHLREVRDAGWTTPADHPDLVPAAEAGRLTDNLRFAHEDEKAHEHGDDFMKKMEQAIAEASTLEELIVGNARAEVGGAERLEAAYRAMSASCTACHVAYRDN